MATRYLLREGGRGVGRVVDLLAVRKDHGQRVPGTKRGDALQLILIQVKGGRAAMPTPEDAKRLRAVARRHCAGQILLATWSKGAEARFFRLKRGASEEPWAKVTDLDAVFR